MPTLTPTPPTAPAMTPHPLFPLGQTVITPGALSELELLHGPLAGVTVSGLLYRHQRGDWGDMDHADRQANRAALKDEARIFSAYNVPAEPIAAMGEPVSLDDVHRARRDDGDGDGETLRVWIITEWDRSYTTILLPEEY